MSLHKDICRHDCPSDLKEAWERQQRSAAAILDRYAEGMDTVLLADDVGMGKTYTALAVAAHTLLTAPHARIVLVTPSGLVSKWEQEIHSFNDKYIRKEGRAVLRPRAISNYWDMVTLLHEYADQERQRVHTTAHTCLLRAFCQWHDKELKSGRGTARLSHLHSVQGVAEDSPEFLRFCSVFSPRSLAFFFSYQQRAHPQEMKDRVAAVREGRSEDALNPLFKEFCRQQSEHTPNIFILRMSSLRRGRSDATPSRLLRTWLALRLLAGSGEATRKTGMQSLLQWGYCPLRIRSGSKEHRAWLDELNKIDLWGLRGVPFPEQEAADARHALLAQADNQEATQEALQVALIACKMSQSNFALAIVDEAHNWKGGKNGAGLFQQNYAPHILHTLLLTATPFQLHPQELHVVLQHVAEKNVQSPSVRLVEHLTRPGGLFTACLNASKQFETAWKALPPEYGPWLQQAFAAAQSVEEIVATLPELPGAPLEIHSFAESIREWHTRMQELRKPLGRIMIRHSKPRRFRQVHAGCDYIKAGTPALPPHRPGLYEVAGYGDEEDALISFLAMRTDQLIRGESHGDTGNAHLREGLSSSFAAFLESHDKKHASSIALSEHTRNYLDFLKKALKKTEHPKVRATVERALHNFQQGKKTLIFCERLATQQELFEKFSQKVMKECFPGGGLGRAKKWHAAILRDPLLTDWYLSRSLCLSKNLTLNAVQRERAAAEAQTHALSLRLRGKRRLARLLDLYLLNAADHDSPITKAMVQLLNDADSLRVYLDAETSEYEEGTSTGYTKMTKAILSGQNIWYTGRQPAELHTLFWTLLAEECPLLSGEQGSIHQLAPVLRALPQGLRRILLRLDVLQKLPKRGQEQRKSAGLIATAWLKKLFTKDDKAWKETVNFIKMLLQADGTLLGETSCRASLWRGVSLKQQGKTTKRQVENLFADKLNGSTSQERRTALCAAFNSPIYPAVLLCTAIGSEGIDLHRCCAEIIHHDLPWNPARLEQRNGRIDRVGRLNEGEHGFMYFGVPFLAHNYEDYQYKTVHQRSQRLEVLLGVGAACGAVEEESLIETDTKIVEKIESVAPEKDEESFVSLPERLVEYLRMDFGVMVIADPGS